MAVGATWWPGLAEHQDVYRGLDVVEVEPQALIVEDAGGRLHVIAGALEELLELGHACSCTAWACPWPERHRGAADELALVRSLVDEIDPPYVSEHIGWNAAPTPAGPVMTGFTLPPRQTTAGVAVAAARIEELRGALGRDIAIEPAANYQPLEPDEMPDGEFIARIVEATGCLVLLDLHNARCNERNGRQPVDAFMAQIPVDQVVEIHLANGFALDGVWLDAHSGLPDDDLVETLQALPVLPRLEAVIVELLPMYLGAVAPDVLAKALDRISGTVGSAPRSPEPTSRPVGRRVARTAADSDEVSDHERRWFDALWCSNEPGSSPTVFKQLAVQARLGSLAAALPRTVARAEACDVDQILHALHLVPASRWPGSEGRRIAEHLLASATTSPAVTQALRADLAELEELTDQLRTHGERT